jgi:hypothetical protein
MLTYNSNSQFPTPAHQQAVAGMQEAQTPYQGQNHADVFNALRQRQAVDMSRYAQQQADAYEQAAGRAERESALQGLSMMGQAQQNNQSLQNSRMQMLLSGLL